MLDLPRNRDDVMDRLVSKGRPSLEELDAVLDHFVQMSSDIPSRIHMEISRHIVGAVRKFDETSATLTRRLTNATWILVALTGALVVMTGFLIRYTIVLAKLASR